MIIQPLALSKNQKLRSLTLRGLDRQGSPFWSLPSTQKQWTSHPCRERAACSKHFFSKVSTKFCQLFRRGESFERLKRLDTNKATIKKKQTNKQTNKQTKQRNSISKLLKFSQKRLGRKHIVHELHFDVAEGHYKPKRCLGRPDFWSAK